MGLAVKICGINHPDAMAAALAGGAHWLGFVFYPLSPRAVAPMLAAELARQVPTCAHVVALFVDPDDELLEHVVSQVPVDVLQLHGSETPDRIRDIKARFGIPVIKAFRIASAEDLEPAETYAAVADRFLFDAKPPPKVATLPGGNGLPFDWTILAGRRFAKPWMLSGGLSPANLEEAVRISGAPSVDVSSGVEDRPGHKSPDLIRHFLGVAANL